MTVSTVGVTSRIPRLAREHPEVALAVSLHAATQELRQRLLPASAQPFGLETSLFGSMLRSFELFQASRTLYKEQYRAIS